MSEVKSSELETGLLSSSNPVEGILPCLTLTRLGLSMPSKRSVG